MGNEEHIAVSFPLWSELTALLPFLELHELLEILDMLDISTTEWAKASDHYVDDVLANDAGARADELASACARAYEAGRDAARARLDFIRQQFGRASSDCGFEAADETHLLDVKGPGVALPFGTTPSAGFIAQPLEPRGDDDAAGLTAALPALREGLDDTLPFVSPTSTKHKDR